MAWKLEKKIFCVTTYIETKSYKTVQTCFRRKFNFNTYPGKSQIFLWHRNFQIYGTVNKRSKKLENPSSGRKLSARSADNVEASRVSVGRSPKKSIRRRSSELGISRSSLHKILTQDLHLYSVRIATFIYSSIDLKVTMPQEYLGFSRISVEIKLPAEACFNSLIGFSLYISRDAKNFFF